MINNLNRTTESLIAEYRLHILEELNNVLEGGYEELLMWTPEQVADDMRDFASDCDLDDAVMLPVIKEWQAANKK